MHTKLLKSTGSQAAGAGRLAAARAPAARGGPDRPRGRRRSGPPCLENPRFPLKGSFKADIGPYKDYMGLCWKYFGL